MILAMGWPVANFIIFVGVLYYFLNQPFNDYLADRSATIRKDLVEAAELKAAADRAARHHRTEAAGAARRARRAAHARRRRNQGRRAAHCRRRGRRSRAPARTDAPRDRAAGAAREEGNPRARRRPLGAARHRAHQEGSHAGRSGSAGRSLSRPGEGAAVDVAPNFGESLRQGALRRRAAGEGRPRAGRSRPRRPSSAMMQASPDLARGVEPRRGHRCGAQVADRSRRRRRWR